MFSVALSGTAFPKASAKLQPFLPNSKYFSSFNSYLTFRDKLFVPVFVVHTFCSAVYSISNQLQYSHLLKQDADNVADALFYL